jgi:thioredoxin:protein disulfide reductase
MMVTAALRLLLPLFAALAVLFSSPSFARAAEEFLDPEVAFKLVPVAPTMDRIELRFEVAPGYYLYGDKFSVRAEPASAPWPPFQAPQGEVKFDETFQKDVETFRDAVTLLQAVPTGTPTNFKLVVGNQGCADKGLCYPPMERAFKAEAVAEGGWRFTALSDAEAAAMAPDPARVSSVPPGRADGGEFAAALQSRSLWQVAGAFWLAGLLLAFTPCVLPMLPILSSIVVGQGVPVSRAQGLGLAASYSLGMALVYTALGMAAGLAGEGLAAALQNGWVLSGFALLLVGLSLSMFGVYEVQLPAGLQSRVTQLSGRMQGGRATGVFLMGGLSALIVGPCVAAPLAGALVYISQTRDVWLGGAALFSMAVGMSVPLLLLGASAGAVLPRAGAWMERIKHVFGVLLLGVALWMISPVIPAWALMLCLSGLLLATAVYLGAFERLPERVTPGRAATKGLGLLLAVLAMLQLAGVASGGRAWLQPLKHLSAAASWAPMVPAGDALSRFDDLPLAQRGMPLSLSTFVSI